MDNGEEKVDDGVVDKLVPTESLVSCGLSFFQISGLTANFCGLFGGGVIELLPSNLGLGVNE